MEPDGIGHEGMGHDGMDDLAGSAAGRGRRGFSLRTQVAAALAGMVFLVVAVLGGLVGETSVSQVRNRIGQSLATDAARVAEQLNREMADRARELALLGALDPMRNLPNLQTVTALLENLRHSVPAYNWLALVDLQGKVVASTDEALVGTDLSNRPDIRDTLRGRTSRTDTEPGRAEEPRALVLTHPIRASDGAVVGVTVAQLNWDWVRDMQRQSLSPDAGGVIDRQLVVVSATDQVLIGPPDLVGTRLGIPAINRSRAGFLGYTVEVFPDRQPYLIGAGFAAGEGAYPGAWSAQMRWTVLVREAQDAAYEPAQALRMEILETALLLALAAAALGWLIAGRITRPLRKIAESADSLRRGDDVELPVFRKPAEIVMLSASLRALVRSLTDQQTELEQMETLTQHDPLTGLMNRVGLRAWLTRASNRARVQQTGLLLLVADLDGFKAVNDTLGHAAGDHLLQEVARRLTDSVRSRDGAARLGGDEFVLALDAPRGLGDHDAVETAKRVLSRVTEPYVIEGELVRVGMSLGGASWPEDHAMIDQAMMLADAALYAAKRAGKGRITFHREPVPG